MTTVVSVILFLVFVFISSIHFYWAFGGKWANDVVVLTKEDSSTKLFTPSVLPTLVVAFGLLSFGLFNLATSGLIAISAPQWLQKSLTVA